MADSVAQLVEQYTFNVWVLGSNPSRVTNKRTTFQVVFFMQIKINAFSFCCLDLYNLLKKISS